MTAEDFSQNNRPAGALFPDDAPERERAAAREARIREKAALKIKSEWETELALLRGRGDFGESLAYFTDLLETDRTPALVSGRLGRPLIGLMCVQAPPELFLAHGLHPFRLFGGSMAAAASAPPGVPALMCPLLKSLLGAMAGGSGLGGADWVVPSTCDWVTGFAGLRELCFGEAGRIHVMDLPRHKEHPEAGRRWRGEVLSLWESLAETSGRRPGRKELLAAVRVMEAARAALGNMVRLRREGRVPAVWFFAMAKAFFLDAPENWILAMDRARRHFAGLEPMGGPGVFLTGSPIVPPNNKLMRLLEEAGFPVLGDDMCSGERLLFRHVAPKDGAKLVRKLVIIIKCQWLISRRLFDIF
jgi:benzoyl-CoA reductase/2-hydroxyglutaryl-CoA dehydratase subunit BcrC/BadD/HgdB